VILETSRELDVAKDGTRFVCCWDPTAGTFHHERHAVGLPNIPLRTESFIWNIDLQSVLWENLNGIDRKLGKIQRSNRA
jgi:hypothetical protein